MSAAQEHENGMRERTHPLGGGGHNPDRDREHDEACPHVHFGTTGREFALDLLDRLRRVVRDAQRIVFARRVM